MMQRNKKRKSRSLYRAARSDGFRGNMCVYPQRDQLAETRKSDIINCIRASQPFSMK